MDDKINLTAEQVRSARALLQWSQADLAHRADVAVSTIADFEKGQRVSIPNNISAIQQALESVGVRFSPGGASLIHELSFFLISEGNAAELYLHYTAEGTPAVQDFLAVFGKVQGGEASIDAVQSATARLRISGA